ncbi:ATPase AAA [Arenicella chitinivorans]|uniref:Replication-associated recombination protein A n=1 Tax=Arenicella chitinivorans TaxID=1329800 RepID=A0A918RWU9_9GAMM|nr:replication-associated recombination protein A [Arenicella chitinivorans]GHA12547.1 ATPase AAA [Arenicella chitinivorans]
MSVSNDFTQPLADRLRPTRLDHVVGQRQLLAPNKPLRTAIETGKLHSMVFWGPPGTGKTTLAKLLAHESDAEFVSLSAVLSGVKDIRDAVQTARDRQRAGMGNTVLFVDEVHRFNKAQQDAFLPHIEDGTILFVGATTENPSFELNNALLSRVRVYVLQSLTCEDLVQLIDRALTDEHVGLGSLSLTMDDDVKRQLADLVDGDARRALTMLEIAADLSEDGVISKALIADILAGGSTRRFDKGGEAFYDQISALHKSVRGSDPDAALYWMCRMLDGGCDPRYIARRVVRMASEDIGNADPRALRLALDAWECQERLGSPEGELTLAQAVVYLAVAAKSNAVYTAYKAAMATVRKTGSLEVPMHIRNAPTKLMKELDYGKGYRYAHDEEGGYAAGETYLPEPLIGTQFYQPVDRGLEIKIREKLIYLRSQNK